MYRLSLTPRGITLLQEDGAPTERWTWAERAEAVETLRNAGFVDGAEVLEGFASAAAFPLITTAPKAIQLRLPEAA